ncbi:hypothetical protein PF005_g8096 [Phytophthora fragariae]|uniref:Uncharacterized protein n=1 Tax=Phytophthora fragariae TaxID=53985 RepID=A0A6A4BK28_9STRA|nr:hypothetical protein PF003_g6474 [Phytophthora fragariae]KAE8942110.1 hypothetical protein PF009_g8119 [Phytophthora fragariae]KAE9018128.1 hypothetical protein PF011_g6409 [Phytophthora fragariae]KAE9070302.1 hypothetical protein PF010_g26331 [Phytophthora fragariae]KAE9126425.1 hypothetical protein PF007_g5979 [Phytophthora fragariae]
MQQKVTSLSLSSALSTAENKLAVEWHREIVSLRTSIGPGNKVDRGVHLDTQTIRVVPADITTLFMVMALIRVVMIKVFGVGKMKTPDMAPIVLHVLAKGITLDTVMMLVMNATNSSFVMGGRTAMSTVTSLLFLETKQNMKIE